MNSSRPFLRSGVCRPDHRSRTLLVAVLCALCRAAAAQEDAAPTPGASDNPSRAEGQPIRLPEMIVRGRGDSLVGVAESASQGTVGAAQLELRPVMRTAEILETVPGVIITQHAGG